MAAFVAEVSSNHAQDLQRCLAFISRAAELGCAAVKFQLFRIDQLFAPEVLARSADHRRRRAWELPPAFLPDLASCCRDHGIELACTPFDLEAVDLLLPHVAFFKVASYELLWDDLLARCAQTGKRVVLSTGMATLREVEGAVATLRDHGCQDPTLLHCVSGYPTPRTQCNLAAIETLRRTFSCPVGWSDHSRDPLVVARAVLRWGAEMVEFHLDLDADGAEYEGGHCWLPSEIQPLVQLLAQGGDEADGRGEKIPAPVELSDREWRADPADGLRPLTSLRDRLDDLCNS